MKNLGAVVLGVVLVVGPSVPLLTVTALVTPGTGVCAASGMGVGVIPDGVDAELGDGTPVTVERPQLVHAATIITVGSRTPGVDRDGIIVALMAALTESGLRMLANTSVYPASGDYPNDGDGSDHDSLGLFQMRPASGWGSVGELMESSYQARAFFGGSTGPNRGDPPGLLDIAGWRDLGKGQAAQAVEVSAYPDRYIMWEPVAVTVFDTLTRPGAGSGDSLVVGSGRVVFPLPDGTWVKTSDFGWRFHPVEQVWRLHDGTDYGAAEGTPIVTVADGVVSFAGPRGGYGNAIIITHTINGEQVASLYGHMWTGHLHVKAGDKVTAGQHIADVGSAGQSTGPHLHLEIRPNNDDSQVVDPDQWLSTHGVVTLTNPSVSTAGCYLGAGV
jgi:hypothetical protein